MKDGGGNFTYISTVFEETSTLTLKFKKRGM
jgi:hypothetical protein